MDSSRIGRRPFLATALVGAALVAGCGGGDAGTGTQSSTTGDQTSTSAQGTTAPKARPVKETPYPYFGRVPERTHDSPNAPDPPFRFRWTFWAHQLVEFPPAVSHATMYLLNKAGGLYALRTSDGKVLWQRRLGSNQTGPAYAAGSVFVAQGNGAFTSLDARTGRP